MTLIIRQILRGLHLSRPLFTYIANKQLFNKIRGLHLSTRGFTGVFPEGHPKMCHATPEPDKLMQEVRLFLRQAESFEYCRTKLRVAKLRPEGIPSLFCKAFHFFAWSIRPVG